jgi:benzaldehyde dehydrogenase (NAD)
MSSIATTGLVPEAEATVNRGSDWTLSIFGAMAALVVLLALAPAVLDGGTMRLMIELLLYLSLAQMWNLLAGYAGLVSVGQQAFVGVGGYMLFALAANAGLHPLVALIGSGFAGAIAAAIIGAFLFRLRGPHFAIGTWVMAEICLLTVAVMPGLGGGSGFSLPVAVVRELGTDRAWRDSLIYWLALGLAVVSVAGSYAVMRSRFGLALLAVRDSERAAESLGVDSGRIKFIVYVGTAAMTALVGGMIFLIKLRMTPDAAFSVLDWTAYVIFIVIIGGVGRIEGPLLGTLIFFGLRSLLADLGSVYLIVLGCVAVAAMIWAPNGLWGLIAARTGLELFPLQHRYQRGIGAPHSSLNKEAHSMQDAAGKTISKLISDDMAGSIYLGRFEPAKGGTVPVTEKATGEKLFVAGNANAADVAEAAKVAKAAQAAWGALPPTARGDVLRKFAAMCEAHMPEVSDWIIRETGSIPPKAPFEIMTTVREAIEVAGLTGQPVGHILSSSLPRTSYARRVPIGVVGVITPWNSPFILAARVVLPALAMGNSVVLKPDIQTPVCGGYALARLFELAGLPAGVLCVVPGGPLTGEALTLDPNIHMVSFTGSTLVGRRVAENGGKTLKKVALELGGNNAAIIFEDADIEKATSATAFGSFFHQGQICFTLGRHLVHESIAEAYGRRLSERAMGLHVGDPAAQQVHLGPIINEKQAARVETLVRDAVEKGATITAGGARDGLFYKPTVMVNVTTDMQLYKEEIFGPVAPITTFKTEAEAIALANDTAYGLASSIFTRDQGRAMRVARQLRTGIVHINDQTVNHEVFGPIGGMGASGNGARSGGPSALDEYTQWQWITVHDEVPAYPF